MTIQIRDSLLVGEKKFSMGSCPLGAYFSLSGKTPEKKSRMSSCWRGYVATWEIVEDHLYLVDIKPISGDGFSISNLFPGYENRVFAHWVNEVIKFDAGPETGARDINHVPIVLYSVSLTIIKGRVTGCVIWNNATDKEEKSAYSLLEFTGKLDVE